MASTRIVCLAVLAFWWAVAVPLPSHASEVDHVLSGYSLTSWTDGDGVPLGTVSSIEQDSDGYLWLGTDSGLLRFDGVRFTPWDSIGEGSLPKSPVSAVCVARDGSIWVGFTVGGVRRIRNGRVRAEDQPQGALGAVTDIVEDRHGTIWAISDGRLHRARVGHWEKQSLRWNDREPTVLHLYISSRGELWVGTTQAGAFHRLDNEDTFKQESTGFTWDIGEDSTGAMWTTDIVAGFRRLGESNPAHHPFEGSGYRLMHDRRGNLWIATLGEGLWRAHVEKNATTLVERTTLRTGLSSDTVQSLLEDRDGNIWVGTTGGLHRLTERKLTPIENVGFVVDVAYSSDGSAVAGTTNGLVRLPGTAGSGRRPRDASGGPDAVRALYHGADGTLWVGNNAGAWRFANGVFTRLRLPTPPTTAITLITSAVRGGVWLGYNDWLFRWDANTVERLTVEPTASIKRITLAYTDSAGRLWIAFDQGQLGFVNPDGMLHRLGPQEGLAAGTHSVVSSFFEDRQHAIWIGGSGGLSRFADGRLVTLNSENGLPASRVSSIVEDRDDYLWLSVNRGLLRISHDELAQAAANRSHRIRYKLYDTSDGLAGTPLGNIRSARGSDGSLWFVRGGGLTQVNPRDLGDIHGPSSAPLRIEAVVANEERLTPDPRIALPPGTRRLQISYTALALTASNRIRFRYRLDGFDTDWVEAGTRRQAFYTNLSPRHYRFQVEANTEDGMWSPTTASWEFAIRPAFYQTNAFYGASVAAIVLLIAGAWSVRLRRVRREFSLVLAERARLSREIHDTLLQSLVGVALQFDAIANALDGSSSAARHQLVRIRRHVEAYIREARQSIWDLRSPVLETHDLVAALREFGKKAASGHSAHFACTAVGVPRRCSPKVENQLLRIGQEAITNAVRHAKATRIVLEIRFEERTVTLRVSDDGRGFEYEYPAHEGDDHYGLTTMRERAEELGGQFKVATGVGRGTAVETVVPIPANG